MTFRTDGNVRVRCAQVHVFVIYHHQPPQVNRFVLHVVSDADDLVFHHRVPRLQFGNEIAERIAHECGGRVRSSFELVIYVPLCQHETRMPVIK